MRKHKYLKKFLAIALSVSVAVTSLSLEAFATYKLSTADSMEITAKEVTADVEEMEKPHILAEVNEERTETTKMFRMSDGSYSVVTYDQSVHYENDQGDYKEIDNTFSEDVSTMSGDSGERVYRNHAGRMNIQFKEKSKDVVQTEENDSAPKVFKSIVETELNTGEQTESQEAVQKESENTKETDVSTDTEKAEKTENPIEVEASSAHEVTMEVAGQAVSWSYEGISEGGIEWEEAMSESELTGDEKFLNVSKAISTGTYKDAFAYTDLRYMVSPEGIKENIVLKDKKAGNIWKLNVDIGDFTVIQKDEQTVALYNGGENPVMVIAAPLMSDAEGKISTDVTLTMELVKNMMTLTITADQKFLQSSDIVYPVAVDPYFYLIAKSDVSISDTFLSSARPATSMRGSSGVANGSLIVGTESSTYGKTRSLLKMNTLPKLPAGSVITEADLILLNYYSYSAGKSMTVDIRRATADWSQNAATWNNSSGIYENVIQDYHIVPENANAVFDTWEITRLVKGWYEGTYPNYGLMLLSFEAENASPAYCTKYYSSNCPSYTGLYPTFLIAFRCNAGLEDYWTYHEQSVNGGTGYINDYSGNLVFTVPITETTGANMPVGTSFVYNSYSSNQHYLNGEKGNINGAGWMASYGQRLEKVGNVAQFKAIASKLTAEGFDYVWLDGDGTWHFFKKQGDGTYKDEDGLELTMKTGQTYGSYTVNVIEDKDGTKIVFLTNGYLLAMENHLKQKLTFAYGGANLSKIADGAGRTLTCGYESSTVTGITGPDGTVKFAYGEANLMRIDFPDGTKMNFSYTPTVVDGVTYNLLTTVTGRDGMKLKYTYDTSGPAHLRCRVKSVTECAVDGTVGNSIVIDYSKQNSTKFIYTKPSGTVSETYQFNNWGHTKGILGEDGSMVELGQNRFDSSSATSAQLATNHKITNAGSGTKYVNNLLLNHSGENGENNWSTSVWAATQAEFSSDTAEAYLGARSFKVSQNSEKPQRCGWVQSINVTAGKTYTFSAYAKTKDVVKNGTGGASLYIGLYNGSTELKTLECDTQLTGNSGWKRLSLTFIAPADATTAKLYGGLKYVNGTVWFDCFQMEENDTASPYNLVENSDFGRTGSWNGINTASGDGISGGTAKLTGTPGVAKNLYQQIPVNKAGAAFHMRASVKAVAVPYAGKSNCHLAIDIGIIYEDGTPIDWTVAEFNRDVGDWQAVSMTAAPKKSNENRKIKCINIYVLYYNQVNTAYFDNVMVTLDETGTTYSYDSKGNLITSADNAKRQMTYTIDSATDMVKSLKDSTNTVYSYTYDTVNKKQLKSAKENSTGIGFKYTYGTGNNKGNVEKVQMGTVGSMTSNKYIESGTEYTENGAYVKTESDQRGNRTQYDVDTTTGQVNSVTDPMNHQTGYTYDETTKNLTNVTSGNASVDYGYDNASLGNRLKSITSNGTTYNFIYDKWSNVQSINIGGSQTLTTNTYADGNGNLLKSAYGNGHSLEFVYDKHERIIAEKASRPGEEAVQTTGYIYNAESQLARVKDSVNNSITSYVYDLSGRVTDYQNGQGSISYGYDNQDRKEKITAEYGGKKFTTKYSYLSANRPGVTTLPQGKVDRTYDSLQRELVHQVYANADDTKHLRSEINFLDLDGNCTTELVAGYAHYTGTNDTDKKAIDSYNSFDYSYDANGNITKIVEKDGDKSREKTYEYDELNQLIRENDEAQKKTFTYQYDNGGNLLSRTEYVYTTGTLGEAVKTIDYTYGDAVWKDKLTSYDGQTITYDEIGNPLSYRDGMKFEWQRGRQLAGTTLSNETKVSYKYNTNGIRIGKTVGNTETSYFVDSSGTIQAMKQREDRLVFMYDSTGRREGFIWYSGTEKKGAYYYLYNAQSDVIGIVADDFSTVVSYEYDSWGKPTKTSGSQAETVGKLNPFRYRGYVYDAETGLYYVSSRYYDPKIGRFINADGYVSTGQGLLGHNMFAYCLNNPINRVDYSGNSSSIAQWWTSSMWWLCGADAALPIGDLVYVAGAVILGVTSVLAKNTTKTYSKEKEKEKEKVKAATDTSKSPTIIYRYGKINPGNLTPKEKDKSTGLSFSLTPPPAGVKAGVTTIEALNATGKLIAFKDKPNHVSVIPAPHMGTLQNWIDTGSSHPCTAAVKSVIIKWDGGF